MKESSVVKHYESFQPEFNEVDYLLDKVVKDCRNRFFHTFKYRCVYYIKFTNIANNEKFIFNSSHDCIEIKHEYYELIKKIKIAKLVNLSSMKF